jgi:hypothetical protein
MADDRMAALELLRKAASDGDLDFLKEGVAVLAQLVMDAEVSTQIGAARGERAPERRLSQRNGYRERRWDTRVGSIELQIPKLRDGSYFPSLLEPRRRAERALLSVVQEAYVGGVSTRRVEELVGALGVANLSKSEVSRICAGLDAEVDAFRSRPLDPAGYPYVSLDALYHKVRQSGRVVSMATLIAIGISAAGERSVLGVEVRRRWRRGQQLAALPALAQRAWPERRAAGHQRRPPGPGGGGAGHLPGQRLAALSGARHAQRAGSGHEGRAGHGGLRHPLHLRAARRGQRTGPAAARGRRPAPALRQGR